MIRLINGLDKFILANFDFTGKPQLDAKIKGRLREYYAEDICNLEELIETDLSHWKS